MTGLLHFVMLVILVVIAIGCILWLVDAALWLWDRWHDKEWLDDEDPWLPEDRRKWRP